MGIGNFAPVDLAKTGAKIGIAPKIFQAKVFLEKLLPGIVHKTF